MVLQTETLFVLRELCESWSIWWQVFSAGWDSWRCRCREAVVTPLYYLIPYNPKCQQLTLTVDIIVSSAMFHRGQCHIQTRETSCFESLSLFWCGVTKEPDSNCGQLPPQSDMSHKSDFIQKIYIQNYSKNGPGADLCLTESDYLRHTSRGP